VEESLFSRFLKQQQEETANQPTAPAPPAPPPQPTQLTQLTQPTQPTQPVHPPTATTTTTTTTTKNTVLLDGYNISLNSQVKVSPSAWNSVFQKKDLQHGKFISRFAMIVRLFVDFDWVFAMISSML
jgi:hypothetical protein